MPVARDAYEPLGAIWRLWMLLLALAFVLLLAFPNTVEAQTADELITRTAAQLNALTPNKRERRKVYVCTNCLNATTCTTGGGSTENLCKWNGSAWTVVGAGSLVAADIDTSAELRGILGDENGTGAALFDGATSPNFTTDIQVGGVSGCLENGVNCPPGILGGFFAGSTGSTTLSTSAVRYFSAIGVSTVTATEGDVRMRMPGMTPVEFYCIISGSALAAGQYTFTLRNTGADTDWSCVVSVGGGITNCSDTSGSALAVGDMAISSTPASTPDASRTARCYIAY